MRKFVKRLVLLLLIGIMLISSFFIYKNFKEDGEQEEIFEEIKDIAIESNNNEDDEQEDIIDMQKLYEINSDIVAWIRIDNTNIDYPIMQTKENKNYYLRRNFYKQYSYWGTPYLAENNDIKTSDNLIIYGHHINNSKMFGELENYKSKIYYEEHKNIHLYTLEETREYEIISVFKTVACNGFEYYNFIKAVDEGEFNTFVNKCKELSFYNTENTAIYGDKLLTLSTCEYSSKNGRLVVVAKQINNKEQELSEDYQENIENEKTEVVVTNNEKKESSKVEKQEEITLAEDKKVIPEVNKNITSSCDESCFIDGHLISYPSFSSNYATLKISKIGVNAPIYLGATDELLLKGVVHDTGSYFCGENGAIIMCGHNYMNNFRRLRRISQ